MVHNFPTLYDRFPPSMYSSFVDFGGGCVAKDDILAVFKDRNTNTLTIITRTDLKFSCSPPDDVDLDSYYIDILTELHLND